MKPDYSQNDPKGWCGDPKRGAAMGRTAWHLDEGERDKFAGKLFLSRVYLGAGGYDCNGTYFGTGEPLYWCADGDGTIDFVLRAANRETAKHEVRANFYPNARFY